MAASRRSSLKRILPAIVIVIAAIATFVYMRAERQPRELLFSGTLEARTVNVGSLVGGRVTRVLVDEGAHVVPGQLLVTLETDTIDRQINEQRAVIETARAQYAKALAGPRPEEIAKAAAVATYDDVERRRMARLYHAGIVAKADLDEATAKAKASAEDLRILQKGTRKEDIEAARAQVEQQQRRLETLLEQRAETEVKATVGGVVQSIGLRPGDLVAPNQSVAELLEANQIWVRVYVPETELGLIRVNMAARVRVDTFPDVWFAGRVGAVSSQGEYTPRNVQTKAQRAEQVYGVKVLVDPDPRLKAGMAADVDFGVKGRAK